MEEVATEDRAVPEEPRPRRRKGRGRRWAAILAVVLGVGGVTATMVGLSGGSSGTDEAGELPPSTTKVTRQTLTDTHTADGDLGHGLSATASARLRGTLTRMPETGDRITRGKALYEVDGDPVVLMYGSMPAYRTLRSGDEGTDVKQLETNLRKLGYTGFTVDDEYTADTADAVSEWQEDKGLEETGVVELGRVVFASGPVRVDAIQAGEGDALMPGGKVLTYTGTAKAVTVNLDAADQRLAKKGAKVAVTLPDNSTIEGRIDEVTTLIDPGAQGEDPTTKVEVVIELPGKAQKEAEEYALASVDVEFTADKRENVLTVPVAALVALREGGFGVEVVNGATTSHVPVETGLFADGRVEISGNGIAEGTVVGMPK
ncbi:efflux RND transporter periplasmic adaptor subunit [Thermomonospora umbrina]|uniref:Multidrug efflux pump subunit AcrA (Membrane-fusion protein) n=1 Tax=Thermomonospora umbrina TaxID=111806 RepID=A0A3D9SMA8_9ACTN|nr:peptidoglycan-binding protein [Thermomonospora umbrina]REE96867.1 multidrug efflux pump subunit AcrA (membrane-fusion protein) [Thermomonospora umbrina]